MLQLADLGSVPVAFIFPSAFIAPFEGGPANKLLGLPPPPCPSCGVPGSGGRRAGPGGGRLRLGGSVVEGSASSWGRREDDGRPLAGCKSRCRTFCPRPHFLPFSSSSWICFLGRRGREARRVSRELLPSFLPLPPPRTQRAPSLMHRPLPASFCPPRAFPGRGVRGPGHRLAKRGAARGGSAPGAAQRGPKKALGGLGRQSISVFFGGQWYCPLCLRMSSGDISDLARAFQPSPRRYKITDYH